MKRLLFWMIFCLSFSACSKEKATIAKSDTARIIYLRVKQVSASGDAKYSKTVRLIRTPAN